MVLAAFVTAILVVSFRSNDCNAIVDDTISSSQETHHKISPVCKQKMHGKGPTPDFSPSNGVKFNFSFTI